MDRLRLLLPLLACLAAAAAAGGTPVAPRIISLAPHLTELLFAAGAGDRVVGTTAYSDHPQAALAVPRVGDAFRLDFERILALHPDVAVAWQSGTPAGVIARLESLGIDVIEVPTSSLADVADAIELLGRLAGTPGPAAQAAGSLRRDLEGLRRGHAAGAPMRVFIEIGAEPLYTVTGRHLISEVVSLCGGQNLFADLPGIAPAVDLEAVISRDPQVILSTVGDRGVTARWSRWPSVAAVRLGQVHAVSPDELSRPSPRIVRGATEVCALLAGARQHLARAAP